MFGKKFFAITIVCVLTAAVFVGCGMLVVSEEGVVSKLKEQGYDLHFFSAQEIEGINLFELESSEQADEEGQSLSSGTAKPVAASGIPPKVLSAISAGRSDGEWIKIYWFKDADKAKAYYDYHVANGVEDLHLKRDVVYRGSANPIHLLFE